MVIGVWTGKVMFEKRWAAVPPQLFTANGTVKGEIKVADSSLFKVKQQVNITASTLPPLNIEIKSIPDGETIWVGPANATLFTYTDVSAYTMALGAAINANEQKRSSVPQEEVFRAVYEEEPVVALRNVLVDKHGNKFDEENPLPVNATVSVVVPPVTVDLDALTPPNQADPDNVLIAGSEDGTKGGLKHAARVDSELDLRVGISDGANKAIVNGSGELAVVDGGARSTLVDILTKLNLGLDVNDANTQAILNDILIQLEASGGLMIGTEDGTLSGVQRVIVNNLKQQILATQDRQQEFTWADITNKKNRRLTRVEYTSSTISGFTVRKDFIYTLAGGDYVVTDINWSLIP